MPRVTMPQLDVSLTEATIVKWLKARGDHVAKYEPLLEVSTDKVNVEVPSPFEGILAEILALEGETVPNDAEIAVIDSGEAAIPAAPEPGIAVSAGPAVASEAAPVPVPAAAPGETPSGPEALSGGPNAPMTPAVRKLLRDNGLDPAQIVGSEHGGRITREDVLRYLGGREPGETVAGSSAVSVARVASASPAPAGQAAIEFPPGVDEMLVPMTQMRRGIAAQMTRALQVPHAYVSLEVDMTNLVGLRRSAKLQYEAREGLPLSIVPFVVRATVEALGRNPSFNAHWTEAGLVAKRRINVGVAVALDDGLLVPVIRDADTLSINALNHAIAEVAARSRAGAVRPDDLGGGTFTVDNTGRLRSNMTLPIINVPEVGILTMEEVRKRAVVVETPSGDAIAIRPIMNMVLGLDHRANDGAGGARFLRDVRAWLESAGPGTNIG
jgi:2-oxoisovalerate dehydrogenase E2 component (dihydrolipoyl transacylase)